ncbi:C4-dicarboxylate ABC transporter substrate-binding protein [Pontibacillus halophilus JSM 076056 = DSM 19796]|uniref:C4-dicarboxylate ABC transporter substrate-binding protein n=1 Tax=Pontibacillus halophilus JSM 076056 = DSM 19796 TaxID=1385510 RepID=A0A0A5GFR8_9BACI|nr:TRAP transporter substrate-binding protein [Pontibacillus halophilus]KGX89965.1 C4-dicarboxylate ABC transporter substrate-binding protein [Pontibacillus halophilus JSM 076056 = DSM 19796]
MKKWLGALMMVTLSFGLLVGCGNEDSEASGKGDEASSGKELKLAHNLSEDHAVHKALVKFKEGVEEKTDMSVKIFANGVLGSEKEVLEQLQSGAVDMTKVSAGALESFSDEYSVFSLPYIFESKEHYHKVMGSDIVQGIYQSTEDKGFRGLTYFDAGARSFYTKDTQIETPSDLDGLKIRVMDSPTAIKMVELMGGTPTPMPYAEIYTALQQGVVDGAESNPTALTTGKHGEVSKAFSRNEHTMIPDIAIISQKTWDSLSEEQQQAFTEAAEEATDYHRDVWNEAVAKAEEESKEMGVTFYEVDKEPFIEAVQPMFEEAKEDERIAEIINGIKEMN